MLLNNRRMYINRYCNSKAQTEHINSNRKESKDEQKDVKDLIIDSLKSISENISKIKESIATLNEKVEKLETKQNALEQQFEQHIDNDYPERRTFFPSELSNDKKGENVFEINSIDTPQAKKENMYNKAIMPGSGFSNITPDFLRNLNKKY